MAAIQALERAGRRFNIVSTATTVAGQQSAVLAGLAVTVGTADDLVPGLRVVEPGEGLPELGHTTLTLAKAAAARQPVTDLLGAMILEALEH